MTNELHRPELANLEDVEWEEIPPANRWNTRTDWHALSAKMSTLASARHLVEYLLAQGYVFSSYIAETSYVEMEYELPQATNGTYVRVRLRPETSADRWRWQIMCRADITAPWRPFDPTIFVTRPSEEEPLVAQARAEYGLGLRSIRPTLFW
ncbi:MAG TPA: hypothetical protein VFO38_03105 [Candidatus Saccharimonadales bacterium]|nr:hypothetical protein [Candidatus Saccharimonadales bacterium]